jgi:hypothetical protein
MGFALPLASMGVHAAIFYDQVEQLTDPRIATLDKMLAHAIAHEIGHVLLASVQHSPTGLMKARWDKTDFLRLQAGALRFTSEEAEIIREHARLRMQGSKVALP